MLIEVDTGIWYDTDLQPDFWYLQSTECQLLGQETMQNTAPVSLVEEDCLSGEKRMISGVWERTTATGTFRFEVDRFYKYPADSKAFLQKSRQDKVVLTQLA